MRVNTSMQDGSNNPLFVAGGSAKVMASEHSVRQYLAYWFQLGKKVIVGNGQEALLPQPVIEGDRYSRDFERCWQIILSPESGDCYLEGTNETIAELLTPAWEMADCARCDMPVPMRRTGMPPLGCPCNDISSWPNTEVPLPRSPVSSQARLLDIRDRLLKPRTSEVDEGGNASNIGSISAR